MAKQTLQCGKRILDLSTPQVMGIINVTPDSFSDGGQFFQHSQLSVDDAVRRAEQMLQQGAALIDVGGESTRPGAELVTQQQEMDRVLPVVEAIAQRLDTIISVDTSDAEVIRESAKLGAGLINDVRALGREGALEAVAETDLPVCLMHMQGSPATMQLKPHYDDVIEEVCDFLQQQIERCNSAGISSDRLLLDPGFGFGKTLQHNLRLLNNLDRLRVAGLPLLIGTSRKSMIGAVTTKDTDQRLAGSLATAVIAAMQGAEIIRVHDVAETVDAVKMTQAVINETVV